MCDIESRDATSSALVIVVLNGRTSSVAVFDAEIAAAYVDGLAVSVGNERLQSFGKPAVQSGFQRIVIGIANALGVCESGICPRHGSQRVNGGKISGLTARPSWSYGSRLGATRSDSLRTCGNGIGHIGRAESSGVSFSFVIKASILTARIGG